MKFYSDGNKVTYVQSITTATTFLSSITGIMKNRILSSFPKNFFKYIYTDTSETFQEHNKTNLYNPNLHKIQYPSLTISPQLSIDSPVGGLKNILMSSPNFWIPRDLNRQVPMIIQDPQEKYRVYVTSDYTTFNLRFKIITDSFLQATELGYFLKSRFNDETFKYLSNQYIQAEFPKTFANAIAKMENLFDYDNTAAENKEDMKKLDLILAQESKTAVCVLRKRSQSNNRQCYFYEQKANILTLFTDLDIPDGVARDSSLNSEYEINFRVQVSAWWPNAFILSIDKEQLETVSRIMELGSTEYETWQEDNDGSLFYVTSIGSPIALDRKVATHFRDSSDVDTIGQNVLHEILTFSVNNETTTLQLSDYLDTSLMKIHSYVVDSGRDPSSLLYATAKSYYSVYDMPYTVDYEDLTITFENPITSDVVLDVYVNRAMYDSMTVDMNNDIYYSNEAAMTTMEYSIVDGDETITTTVRVYGFEDDADYASTDINKSLRVYTTYGIGYIGLVMEGTTNASDLKICVGYDKYENPIIRCLEKA